MTAVPGDKNKDAKVIRIHTLANELNLKLTCVYAELVELMDDNMISNLSNETLDVIEPLNAIAANQSTKRKLYLDALTSKYKRHRITLLGKGKKLGKVHGG